MKLLIDTEEKTVQALSGVQDEKYELYSKRAFELITDVWLKVGWNQKYVYTFTWMGRPIIQLPEDLIRVQEAIYRIKPDVIIETGIAHGGSLIYYASLCRLMNHGRVIGIDIEIRPHNRRALEAHELYPLITLVEGSSTEDKIVELVHSLVQPGETVLILLDSSHAKHHVLNELEAYHDLVSPGSYIVVTDGIMRNLYDVPRGEATWKLDNPAAAAREFINSHAEFVIEQPAWPFNESDLNRNVTHWPDAWLGRHVGEP